MTPALAGVGRAGQLERPPGADQDDPRPSLDGGRLMPTTQRLPTPPSPPGTPTSDEGSSAVAYETHLGAFNQNLIALGDRADLLYVDNKAVAIPSQLFLLDPVCGYQAAAHAPAGHAHFCDCGPATVLHNGFLLFGLRLLLADIVVGQPGRCPPVLGGFAGSIGFVNLSGAVLSDRFDAASGRIVGVDAAVRISESAALPVVTAGWFIPMALGAALRFDPAGARVGLGRNRELVDPCDPNRGPSVA